MTSWSEDELHVLFREYLEMLEKERAGIPYVKTHANRNVQAATGRSKSSVEYKFANTSAVLEKLGIRYLDGYKPRRNFQQLMEPVLRTVLQQIGLVPTAHPSRTEAPMASGSTTQPLAPRIPIAQLLKKSFGGGTTATGIEPDSDYWPVVPFPPGAEAARDLLLSSLEANGPRLHWLFLLGGPGNGKSELTRRMQATPELKPLFSSADRSHRRSYDYTHASGAALRIINDATIRTDKRTLLADLREAVDQRRHLVANVNRGILVEERPARGDEEDLSSFVVSSLLGMSFGDNRMKFCLEPPLPDTQSFVCQFSLSDPNLRIAVDITVVRLDMCSLFEDRPSTTTNGSVLTGSAYTVRRLNERSAIRSSSALSLIEEVVRLCDYEYEHDARTDPIGANLTSLRADNVIAGLGTIFRSAEIASARLFTFREVWGAISLLLLGPMSERDAGLDGYRRLVVDAKRCLDTERPAGETLSAYRALSAYRFTQVLFSERRSDASPGGMNSPWRTPVTKRLRTVDPAIDATPGNSTDLTGGWASPVLDALEDAMFGGSPIRVLSDAAPRLEGLVTDFDRALEGVVLRYCADSETSDADHDATMAWYGRYLLRLFAVAHGIPGFFDPLLKWTRAWNNARNSSNLGDELGGRVKALLVPAYRSEGDQILALPVFSPQTIPLVDAPEEPVVVRRVPTFKLSMSANTAGDRIRIVMRHEEQRLIEVDLDFALTREALASSGRHPGATELGAKASPRLERARASIMALKGPAGQWGVASGNSILSFNVGVGND